MGPGVMRKFWRGRPMSRPGCSLRSHGTVQTLRVCWVCAHRPKTTCLCVFRGTTESLPWTKAGERGDHALCQVMGLSLEWSVE